MVIHVKALKMKIAAYREAKHHCRQTCETVIRNQLYFVERTQY